MSTIYFVHAATSAGIPALKASRATINEALREAEFELSGGAALAWIVDQEGHLILPPDQVRARLDKSARPRQGFGRLIGLRLLSDRAGRQRRPLIAGP
jgi:hypothetical protein